jgi:putative nucleotidyltransferase with HDIG domain
VAKKVTVKYKKCEVPVQQLKFGMYVRELDRPWLETPFMFQGFYVRSVGDIEALKDYCEIVYIDLDKSVHLTKDPLQAINRKSHKEIIAQRDQFWLPDDQLLKNIEYEDTGSFEDELSSAIDARANATAVVESLYTDIRSGHSIDTSATKKAVVTLVDSVVRNPDAHALLMLLAEKDKNRLTHSLNVCTLTLAFGRMMGLPRQYMIELGLGAILHDVGQAKIAIEIVSKEGLLTDEEYEVMKTHTTRGMELLLEENRHLPYRAVDIVYTHHERFDGHGYPQGLTGEAIPLYGRIVAITDFYEATTSQYADREIMSPGSAMTELYAMRAHNFDANLVEEFIKCVGIFPIGCTVLLNSNEVGIVVTQNRMSRLEPKIMLILDKDGHFYPVPRLIDIALFKKEEKLQVVEIVVPEDYGVDVKHYIGNLVHEMDIANRARDGT